MRNSSSSGSGNVHRAAAAGPLGNYQFDFGNLGGGSGNSINGLKQAAPSTAAASPQQPQRQQQQQPWSHKPAASLSGTRSMVGDISGKSWVPLDSMAGRKISPAMTTNTGNPSGIVGGVGSSKADLFGDLLSTPMRSSRSGPMAAAATTTTTTAAAAVPLSRGTPMKNAGGTAMKNAGGAARSSDESGGATAAFMRMSAPPPPAAAMDNLFSGPSKVSVDPLDDLWRKIPPPAPTKAPEATRVSSNTDSSAIHGLDADDWDMGSTEFQSADSGHPSTTELDGLPPPPGGVTGSMASVKGIEFQKQGQFADAIKWLTWAVVLLDKSPQKLTDVLVTRASCYKEVGEYKKAVSDCSQVLEMSGPSAEVLLQRAYLYESMEKYKLCVQDLREALQRDPSNRMAMNTLSRLAKLADG